jgi:CRISPR-associated endonuclease/helicase Cas3
MAFALEHAKTHNLRRVIVVIPYLSIIEQNAREYRMIFGADQVLEHHSSVEVSPQQKSSDGNIDEPPQAVDIERAMENWDVPIVVTTAVQFIETLFAASPAKARKLHNVGRSVVIFDEVQTLPTHLLEPTLDMLQVLQKNFGVSVLFCSATQPAFLKSGNLKHGFQKGEVHEIAPSPVELFQKLRRVRYRIESPESCWNWHRLADDMLALKRQQALAIVNLRQHAFDAYLALKTGLPSCKDAVFHLSSAMCAAHRLDLLGLSKAPPKNNVKQRLADKLPCWVVSTQLIEAGVDIDFPTVYRAMGPLDSIVQAAGRCNREGQLRDDSGQLIPGDVIVFYPDVPSGRSTLPPGNYSKATGIAPLYLKDTEKLATDPDLFSRYFNELFQITATDRVRPGEDTIQQSRAKFNFRTVAERARVIDEDTIGVIVPYGQAKKLIASIRRTKRIDYKVLRRLQRFMVNLRQGPKSLYDQLNKEGRLNPLLPDVADIPVLDEECYEIELGVVFKGLSPEELIV